MPQLEFTLWLLKLTISWSLFFTVMINLKNYKNSKSNINTNLSKYSTSSKPSTWKWN